MSIKKIPLLITLCLFATISRAQENSKKTPEFLQYTESTWVDSIMKSLTPQERIGQLIWVSAYSNRGPEHRADILKTIKDWNIGGLVFFQGDPVTQVKLMNEYQNASKVPLMGAIDAEWGLGMRLDSTISFPFQMALGAIQDDNLIYEMGKEMAHQIKRVGLHLNFAPVADVNNNPNNPVINYRSFGEDKYKVAEKSIAYMQGMQDGGLITTAKHFPGHGDTSTDSHFDLPQINHSRERLNDLELYPFKELINAGINGMMVAHLNIPALDPSGVPSTLSKAIINDLLQDQLGFEGLIVTDAMEMKGVTKGNLPGIVDKQAVLAGNDVLEIVQDVSKAITEIKKAVDKGIISQKTIDARVRKILAAKQWVNLNKYEPLPVSNLLLDINNPHALLLERKLTEASLTVLKNEADLLPLKHLDTLKIMSVSIGADKKTTFQKTLDLYTKVDHFTLPMEASQKEMEAIKKELPQYNLVIVGVHDDTPRPRNTIKFSESVQSFIQTLPFNNTVVAYFKNPYSIDKLNNLDNAKGLIVSYQDGESAQDLSAQLIFGGVGANGQLPVGIGKKFKAGDGLTIKGGIRFKYTLPEDAGMDSKTLYHGVDSLMNQAIDLNATPGGQLLVAKNGKVVLHKAYGLKKYNDTTKVSLEDIYDLASVTKISSALPAVMKLYDEGRFDLDKGIDDYLRYFKNSNKADANFREILAHQAGFNPYITYWKNTLRKNGSYKWSTIKKDSSARFPIKISSNMWLHRNYQKKIFKAIKKSALLEKREYKYSGLLFMLLPTMIEEITKEDFVNYVDQNFYNKLGAYTLTYNPDKKFNKNQIIPTEHDFMFRHLPVHGTVHDEGAAMMGGISANAGLFSNTNDLAKLMQMYLNMGTYGGEEYIKESTVKEFTKVQFPENNNHRGLGFDKPFLEYKGVNSNTAKDASSDSFGHTGFTGIMVWMDPKEELLYLFLSNRVLPTRENTTLYKLNTRTNIQQVLYDAIK
ncbi:glycoside hydrolase family 3 N-terminal domain-containing protein [Arenibacter certesii]|uniref:beta-N-acetylhexosaminidase n=1 Tax=Arenibacter certesii TaxID=228955 RepID=A0A918ISR3_9FLAO|nr:glycoside hydrolase family 3 N-terminal domain-containing protein [Arenibacter certesii]GGW30911.1 beta-N-acetylglucosaminidase [Arenibacter certesii]